MADTPDTAQRLKEIRRFCDSFTDGAASSWRNDIHYLLDHIDTLTAKLHQWHAACDAVGVNHDPVALVTHHRNNGVLIGAANSKTELMEAEAERDALRAACLTILEEGDGDLLSQAWEVLDQLVPHPAESQPDNSPPPVEGGQ